LLRRSTLGDAGRRIANPLDRRGRIRYGAIAAAVIAAVAILSVTGVITAERLSDIVVVLTLAAAVALFAVILSSRRLDTTERRRVLSFIPMFAASAIFWSLFQQQFTVVALYADQRLDLRVFGWTMPPSWVQAINPIFIIILAGVFASMWTRLGSRQPTTPVKFAIGTIFMGVAFLLFLPFASGGPNSTPLWWLIVILFFFTLAELCLSPVGQSLSTKLAPKAFHTQMIALFFLSIAVGTAGAGSLAGLYDPANERPYFLVLGAASVIVGLLLLATRKQISRLMEGVR
jgi:proton-dependent oligopeptide transporter, POT family